MPLPAPREGAATLPFKRQRDHLVFVAGTEGTTTSWLRQFVDASATVCRELGRTGILVGGNGTPDESRPESGLITIGFTPLDRVLTGAATVVHHGGIGTCAAALEAGIPQLAIPRVFMQPMNSEWMRRLGVCTVLPPREWTSANAPKCLKALLANREMKRRAEELSARIDRRAALNSVCSFLEEPARYR